MNQQLLDQDQGQQSSITHEEISDSGDIRLREQRIRSDKILAHPIVSFTLDAESTETISKLDNDEQTAEALIGALQNYYEQNDGGDVSGTHRISTDEERWLLIAHESISGEPFISVFKRNSRGTSELVVRRSLNTRPQQVTEANTEIDSLNQTPPLSTSQQTEPPQEPRRTRSLSPRLPENPERLEEETLDTNLVVEPPVDPSRSSSSPENPYLFSKLPESLQGQKISNSLLDKIHYFTKDGEYRHDFSNGYFDFEPLADGSYALQFLGFSDQNIPEGFEMIITEDGTIQHFRVPVKVKLLQDTMSTGGPDSIAWLYTDTFDEEITNQGNYGDIPTPLDRLRTFDISLSNRFNDIAEREEREQRIELSGINGTNSPVPFNGRYSHFFAERAGKNSQGEPASDGVSFGEYWIGEEGYSGVVPRKEQIFDKSVMDRIRTEYADRPLNPFRFTFSGKTVNEYLAALDTPWALELRNGGSAFIDGYFDIRGGSAEDSTIYAAYIRIEPSDTRIEIAPEVFKGFMYEQWSELATSSS